MLQSDELPNLNGDLMWGEVSLSEKETIYIKGLILSYTLIEYEEEGISQRCASHIKDRLFKKFNVSSKKELILLLHKNGVIDWIIEYLIKN